MSDLIVPNIICFQTQKQLPTLSSIGILLKGVLTDLRARNFVHAKTSLRAICRALLQQHQIILTIRFLTIFEIKTIMKKPSRYRHCCTKYKKKTASKKNLIHLIRTKTIKKILISKTVILHDVENSKGPLIRDYTDKPLHSG